MAFILIVDASQAYATRASDVLTAAGHACGCVASAEEAIALLRWRVPELILLDQAIPGADGGTLPHKLRRITGVAELPIILLTTDSAVAPGDVGHAVLDDIRKPFDPGFLAWKVDHALDAHGKRALGERDEPLVVGNGDAAPRLRSLA
uniref:response regulator n=1 Tax=Altererythrobacter segetis TaxID=1104773 RepID=UPI001407B88B|nr:response regulator [Altererythrobacter segetis]